MGARKMSRTSAIGRIARPVRVVLAAAAFALITTAVHASWIAAPASPHSVVATVQPAPAVTAVGAPPAGEFQAAEPLATSRTEPEPAGRLSRPHVLATGVADAIVRIRGGTRCTGTPITGTTFVVTAAHCVLIGDHAAGSRTVLRDGVEYTAVSVLVNTEYNDSPGPRLDAAVLVMDQVIPGPSATLGDAFPTHGRVTLAGFQPLDTDGSLLRGTRYDNRPHPQGAVGGVVEIETAAAGCVHLVSELEITDTQVNVPCGLIPGSSGGGLFVEDNGELTLVGVISTVADDLTYNGVAPLAAVHELLENQVEYTHEMPVSATTRTNADFGISDQR